MARSAQDLLDELGIRVEDAGENTFTAPMKRVFLSEAQIEVVGLVNHAFLTELKKTKTGVTVTTGVTADLGTALTPDKVVGGEQGIIAVKDAAIGNYATKIDFERDIQKNRNTKIGGTVWNPRYYVLENKIYMLPATISSIDVTFLKQPTDLIASIPITVCGGGASTTQFVITPATGLSTTTDYYKYAVIYSVTHLTYHIITAYTGSTGATTVTPALATGTFGTETIQFMTHSFDTLLLSGVTCELNVVLHDAMLNLAEVKCWAMDRKTDRVTTAMQMAKLRIDALNAQYRPATGMGAERK